MAEKGGAADRPRHRLLDESPPWSHFILLVLLSTAVDNNNTNNLHAPSGQPLLSSAFSSRVCVSSCCRLGGCRCPLLLVAWTAPITQFLCLKTAACVRLSLEHPECKLTLLNND